MGGSLFLLITGKRLSSSESSSHLSESPSSGLYPKAWPESITVSSNISHRSWLSSIFSTSWCCSDASCKASCSVGKFSSIGRVLGTGCWLFWSKSRSVQGL